MSATWEFPLYKRRRNSFMIFSVAALSVLPLAATPVAYADVTDETVHLEAADFDIERGSSQTLSDDESRMTEQYIEDQASTGRGLDAASVRIATADVDGGTLGVVFEAGDELTEAVVKEEDGDDGREGFGVTLTSNGGNAAVNGKAGNDAANSSNAALRGRACRSLFFDADNESNEDHYVYDCWEKFQSTSRSQDWFYNRYTLFNPADGNMSYRLVDATIRFKPWSGKESTVAGGPYSYSPASSTSSSCTEYTASVSAGAASLSIPFTNCGSSIEPLPRSDTHAMGTDWDGNTRTTTRLDATATFTSTSTPVFADYVWMTTKGGVQGNARTDNDSWRDSGF